MAITITLNMKKLIAITITVGAMDSDYDYIGYTGQELRLRLNDRAQIGSNRDYDYRLRL